MRRFFLITTTLILTSLNILYSQVANHVVIAEIYGAGGNSGATYKYDYIVLYNPTGFAVDLSTWSVQYQSATGTASPWTSFKTNLTGSIDANSYYLIQESGGTTGLDLPNTPNVIGTINLSATAGKVALVNDQEYITGISDGNVIDFVGYGSTANVSEGSNPALSPSTTSSICREDNNGNQTYGTNGNGNDSDNNGNDFWVNNSPSPLPVELTSFTTNVFKNKVILNWTTATEVNNYGFEILRSAQNENWKKIGFVHGHGNSNSPKNYSYTDEPLGGREFKYRLKQIDFDGTFDYSYELTVTLDAINEFKLNQNYPNPFNPETVIGYQLPVVGFVTLKVFDVLGREVATLVSEYQESGIYKVNFDGSNFPSGTYIYKLETGNYFEAKKFILLK